MTDEKRKNIEQCISRCRKLSESLDENMTHEQFVCALDEAGELLLEFRSREIKSLKENIVHECENYTNAIKTGELCIGNLSYIDFNKEHTK